MYFTFNGPIKFIWLNIILEIIKICAWLCYEIMNTFTRIPRLYIIFYTRVWFQIYYIYILYVLHVSYIYSNIYIYMHIYIYCKIYIFLYIIPIIWIISKIISKIGIVPGRGNKNLTKYFKLISFNLIKKNVVSLYKNIIWAETNWT